MPLVKILDLGQALLTPENGDIFSEFTLSGQIMGTRDFMAPKQAGDSHRVDIRADIYSLEATLYKLLVGQVPVAGASDRAPRNKGPALAAIAAQRSRERRPEVPRPLAAVLERMLELNPDELTTPGQADRQTSPRPKPARSDFVPAGAAGEIAVSVTTDGTEGQESTGTVSEYHQADCPQLGNQKALEIADHHLWTCANWNGLRLESLSDESRNPRLRLISIVAAGRAPGSCRFWAGWRPPGARCTSRHPRPKGGRTIYAIRVARRRLRCWRPVPLVWSPQVSAVLLLNAVSFPADLRRVARNPPLIDP